MNMKYLGFFVIFCIMFVVVMGAEEEVEVEEGAKKTAKRGIYGGLGYGYGGLGGYGHGLYGGYGYPLSYSYYPGYRIGHGYYGGYFPFGYHGYGYHGGYGF